MPPASPLARRCASAQIFIADEHGMAQPAANAAGAGFMQASATKANHISAIVRCRVQVGGVHTGIRPSARYREKPQTISAKPTREASE